ncbi:MAG: DUF58 domain-containing protein [Desulfobacterales bacterium]|nr:DUF58 domain-containing protein [Desulfobacterales bacterium]
MTSETVTHKYLDLSQMEMLRHIRLHPRGLAEGTFSGPHKSQYRGTSVEFSDYRNYVDGDDIRLLDWKAYARSDRYYVRLYESERNLLTYAVIDTSGSMSYSGTVKKTFSKLEYACRLAAALGYLTVREGDEIGLSLADEQVNEHLDPGRSWPHLSQVLDTLTRAAANGKTDMGTCLETVYSRIKRRGVLMVFSDFLDDSEKFWHSVNLFRRSHFDILLFHVVHPEELDLPALDSARFTDSEETGRRFTVEPELVRSLYANRFKAFLAQIEGDARARGCDWFLTRTDENPYQFLKRCFFN